VRGGNGTLKLEGPVQFIGSRLWLRFCGAKILVERFVQQPTRELVPTMAFRCLLISTFGKDQLLTNCGS